MAPEVLISNQYNLKADVYSWAMVCWELLTLHKPYFRYSKDQHARLVCEQRERPPLHSPPSSMWPTTSFHSLSASLSSMRSSSCSIEESINFDDVMTDPMRDLLSRAWHHDVSERLTMKEVVQGLDNILNKRDTVDEEKATITTSLRDIVLNTTPAYDYSCSSSTMDVREMVTDFASDFAGLAFLNCFGKPGSSQTDSSETIVATPPTKVPENPSNEPSITPGEDQENKEPPHDAPAASPSFPFPVPQLRSLLLQ